MNASPVPAPNSSSVATPETNRTAATGVVSKKRVGQSWVVSLTGVCFLFGGLLAMQLRAIQEVQANRLKEKEGQVQAGKLVDQMRERADAAQKGQAALQAQLSGLRSKLASTGSLTKNQIATLNTQIKELETVAGLTPVTGPGIRIVLSDNPNAAQEGGETAFLPGIVHDYDILQVVNELRAAKADAIGVRGAGGETIRVTGYTPIRCVGPVIYINWEPVAAPFTVEAVGEPTTLRSALEMPNGIVDNLKNNGAVGVKVTAQNNITLPKSSTGAPKLKTAKAVF